jgi:hypothetical protein
MADRRGINERLSLRRDISYDRVPRGQNRAERIMPVPVDRIA